MKAIATLLVICLMKGPGQVDGITRLAGNTPWQASVVSSGWFGDSHQCGAALISSKHAITTASCCDGSSASSLKVKYDGLHISKLGTTNPVAIVNMHPSYSPSTRDSDYCILTLQNPVSPSTTVRIIGIANSSPDTGTSSKVTGWRTRLIKRDESSIEEHDHLRYEEMSILSARECNEKWRDVNAITSNMICGEDDPIGDFIFDVGAPLVAEGKLVGILSWGIGNYREYDRKGHRPKVFADPVAQIAWIRSKIE